MVKNLRANLLENRQLVIVACFLLLIFIKYPLFFVAFFPSGIYSTGLFISSIDQLSAFAIFMILLKYQNILQFPSVNRKGFTWAIIAFLSVTILQFVAWPNQTFREFSFAVFWVSIPLAVLLYANTFKRCLLPFLCALWIFCMIHNVWQLFSMPLNVGISANQNWNGAFLIATTPFFLYSLFKLLAKKGIAPYKIKIVLAILTAIVLIALYKSYSRGANLALVLSFLLFLGLEMNLSTKKKLRKYGRLYLQILVVIMVLGLFICPLLFGAQIAEINSRDVRLPLWRGAINMYLAHPLLGVGASGYEGEYAYFMPIERFLRSHYFAGRATHPHNQILFFAGAFGLVGLISLIYLWFVPLIVFLKNYRRAAPISKILFFSFLMLVIHAMLDLVAIRWPTMQLLLIFQGILWTMTLKKEKYCNFADISETEKTFFICPPILKYLSVSTAIVFLIVSFKMVWTNIITTYHERVASFAGDQKRFVMGIYNNQESIKLSHKAIDLHHAAMQSIYWLNDYRLAYKYFILLEEHPAKIVAHSNARTAQCLIKMNRKKEALKYMDKEIKVFPLSSLALHNKYVLQKDMGDKEAALNTYKQLIKLMKFKGLEMSDMQRILAKPELDNRFDRLKEK